jgi:hypothetical protein
MARAETIDNPINSLLKSHLSSSFPVREIPRRKSRVTVATSLHLALKVRPVVCAKSYVLKLPDEE